MRANNFDGPSNLNIRPYSIVAGIPADHQPNRFDGQIAVPVGIDFLK